MGNSSSSASGAQNSRNEEEHLALPNNGLIVTQSHNIGGSYNNEITYIAAGNEVNITKQEQRFAELPKAPNEIELGKLMEKLELIKAALYNVNKKKIEDEIEKIRLMELEEFAIHAEDILDEYQYELLKAQVEARVIQVPDGMLLQIEQVRKKIAEIKPLPRSEDKRLDSESCFIYPSDIFFGRQQEKEDLIHELLSSEFDDNRVVSVVSIVGIGGVGKTALAKHVYNDKQIRQRFQKLGWVCASDKFELERLTIHLIESITMGKCCLDKETNFVVLQHRLIEEITEKRVLIVLDDVWNTDGRIWDRFCGPLTKASIAKILVTTRNELSYLPKESRHELGYLPKEACWRMFETYAFGGKVNPGSNLVDIGEKIMNKCGGLPLAVKSIASLLGHEKEESAWKDIFMDIEDGELRECDESYPLKHEASKAIFGSLQISYARLPTHLKPCFLCCSMFPKDFVYNKNVMVKLWISQGYVTSKGRKDAEEIGLEYAKQLEQRSLFESIGDIWNGTSTDFKLHDLIHDLAQLNSKNADFSVGVDMANNLRVSPNELHHFFMVFRRSGSLWELPNLLTLIIRNLSYEDILSYYDFSMVPKLRALLLGSSHVNLDHNYISSVGSLKHLRYLALHDLATKCLPECICSLYHLKRLELSACSLEELPKQIGNLISLEIFVISDVDDLRKLPESLGQLKALRIIVLSECVDLEELPTSFKNLVSLRKLVIEFCDSLKWSPDESLCQLKALRELIIHCNQVGPLRASLGKLASIETLRVRLECDTIGWLSDFVGLVRVLSLVLLQNVTNLADVERANLVGMEHLDHLQLCWGDNYEELAYGEDQLLLIVETDWSKKCEDHFAVMASLQPHPKLRELHIMDYGSMSFPKWIEDPNSCASLESVSIGCCNKLTSVPFGRLLKLKHLEIENCGSLLILEAESLPLELKELHISRCNSLLSMPGIQNLKSLVTLCIEFCKNLQHLSCATLTMCTAESSHQNSRLVLRNLTALRKLMIWNCPELKLPTDEQLCQYCEATIRNCPLLKNWCLQHGITYKTQLELDEQWRASYKVRPGGRCTNTMDLIHYYKSDNASMWRRNINFL